MATLVSKKIDPDNSGGTDYTSLAAWEAGQNANLTVTDTIEEAVCYSTGGTVDSTVVLINGWTTSATQYIRIKSSTNDRPGTQWDTSKYRLDITSGSGGTYAIRIVSGSDHIEIDGIQVGNRINTAQDMYGIWFNNTGGSAGWCKIHNCIVRGYGTYTVTGYHLGISVYNASSGSSYIWNNIVYDWYHASSADQEGIDLDDSGLTHYVYSNTIQNCRYGIRQWNGTCYAKNNAVNDCTDGFNGTFTSSDYNASDISSDAPGANSQTGEITFADEANDDFGLASGDSVCRGNGTDLSADGGLAFSDDILGNTRSAWDIGAHEYQTADVIITPSPISTIGGRVNPTVVLGTISIAMSAISAITGSAGPVVVMASLTLTPSALSAIAGKVDPSVVLSSLVLIPASINAVAGVVNPYAIQGSITFTPIAISAVTGTTNPVTILGTVTLTPPAISVIGATIDPTVAITGDVVITPNSISAITSTVNPSVVLGTIQLTPAAISALTGVVDPDIILGTITVVPIAISAIGSTVDPNVIAGGDVYITPTAISAYGSRINPSVLLGSMTVTPSGMSAITSKTDPTVVLGTIQLTPMAIEAITAGVNPVVIIGAPAANSRYSFDRNLDPIFKKELNKVFNYNKDLTFKN